MIIAATMIIIINVVDIFRYLDFIQSSPRILQPPSAQCSLFFCLKHHHHRCHLCNYHDTGYQSLSQLYVLKDPDRNQIHYHLNTQHTQRNNDELVGGQHRETAPGSRREDGDHQQSSTIHSLSHLYAAAIYDLQIQKQTLEKS